MGLNAKKVQGTGGGSGSKQEPLDAGTYPARVVQIIDLGLQPQKPFQGKEKEPQHEINMGYECLDEFCVDEDGNVMEDKPRWLSESFPFRNLKAEKAKSTARYKALDPEEKHDGDFTKLVETPCMLTVVQNPGKGQNAGKIYNNIVSVAAMRAKDAAKAPPLKNAPIVFVLDEPDLEVFNSLPEFLQNKIKANLNYNGSKLQALLEGKEYTASEPEDQDDGESDSEGDEQW